METEDWDQGTETRQGHDPVLGITMMLLGLLLYRPPLTIAALAIIPACFAAQEEPWSASFEPFIMWYVLEVAVIGIIAILLFLALWAGRNRDRTA